MTRVRSNTVSETGIAFFSAGGHNHDGINSSIIDTTKYSIFDFNFGLISTNSARLNNQGRNEQAFKDFIIRTVNQSVLEPAGVVLQDNIINSRNIISGSITSEEIAANTITANNIAANTITGDLIAANTIAGNSIVAGSITATQIEANALVTDNLLLTNGDFWKSNGAFRLGGTTGITYSGSGTVNFGSGITITGSIASTGTISGGTISGGFVTGAAISGGSITASDGSIGGWSMSGSSLSANNTFLYSNGTIVCTLLQSKSTVTGSIRLGANVGSGEELEFYRSNSSTLKNTLRTVAGGSNTFRISTIDNVTFNFDTRFYTSGNIAGGNISATTSLSAPSVICSSQFRGPSGDNVTPTYSFTFDTSTGIRRGGAGQVVIVCGGVVGGVFSSTGLTSVSGYNGVFLNTTIEGHSRVETTLGGSLIKVLNSSDGVQVRNGFDSVFHAIRASAFNIGSSIETKKDLEEFNNAIDYLLNTKVYKWKYIDDTNNKDHIFPIAEDLPECLLTVESTGDKVVDLRDTVGFIWKAIQELTLSLDQRIKILEKKFEEM
jgi:hypothetical protein